MINSKNKLIPIFVSLTYIFLYVPILVLIAFSFNNSTSTYQWQGFTLKWYAELFHSSQIWSVLLNSLIVAVSSVLLCLFICILAMWASLQKN
jgi:spermidine/putrescine transport system permease protein